MADSKDPKHTLPPAVDKLLEGPLADVVAKGVRAGADVITAHLTEKAKPAPTAPEKELTKPQLAMAWLATVVLLVAACAACPYGARSLDTGSAAHSTPAPQAHAQVSQASTSCTTVSTVEHKAADGTVSTERTEKKGPCESKELRTGESIALRAAYTAFLAIF